MRRLLRPGGSLVIGVLNTRSWLGITRKLKGKNDPVFHNARSFSIKEIRTLLESHGKTIVQSGAFLLPYRSLLWSAEFLENIGRKCFPGTGNFIAGKMTI